MPSRILASFVPFLFIAASLAQAAKSDNDDCCPTGCPPKCSSNCQSNGCVRQPKCPCPPANSCIVQNCQCNPNGCCAKGNCTLPPAAPPVNDETPAARRQVAPRAAVSNVPPRGRVITQAPARAIQKPVETPAQQSSQTPASQGFVVALTPKQPVVEKAPVVERADEDPVVKPAPTTLEPMTAEELSMPPLDKPLPAVRAGVVESSSPRALFVTPTSATNSIRSKSNNTSQGPAAATEKPQPAVQRTLPQSPRTAFESGVPNVRPLSEFTPSRDPLPPPMAPEYSSVRRK